MQKNKKILYFLSHPIQYFSPLLKELGKYSDLKVYYFSDASIRGQKDNGFGQNILWDTPLLDGYNYSFVKNFSKRKSINNNFWDVFNPGVINILWKNSASIIIVNGWTYSSTLIVIFFAKLFGKEVWLRAENPLNQELRKRPIILRIKKFFLKHILFNFFISRFLFIGTENKNFFEFYGVPASKLIYTPYAVDNTFFAGEYEKLKKEFTSIRVQLKLPLKNKIILFCGKYISKKRPLDLIKAFKLMNKNDCSLVMVGEGELRQEMEKYISDNNVGDVHLTGFINQSNISKYYTTADVFVMCSGLGETWGLSINEAMNFEKPVIISKTCGSCPDLVKQGENGFAFEEGNIVQLSQFLISTLDNYDFRKSAGQRSAEIIKEFSIDNIVNNILVTLN